MHAGSATPPTNNLPEASLVPVPRPHPLARKRIWAESLGLAVVDCVIGMRFGIQELVKTSKTHIILCYVSIYRF